MKRKVEDSFKQKIMASQVMVYGCKMKMGKRILQLVPRKSVITSAREISVGDDISRVAVC